MNRILSFLAIVFLGLVLPAQLNHFSFVAGGGPAYFFKDGGVKPSVNYSTIFGINYRLGNKRQAVLFNPGVYLQANKYHTKADEHTSVHVTQRAINLHLDVMLKMSKSMYLKAGIFFNALYHHGLRVVQTNTNGKQYFSFSNNAVLGPYSAANFQAGINAGICFPFRLFHRDQLFGIQFNHIVSPLVNRDYLLGKDVTGKDVTVLTTGTRASMLLLTLEFNLKKQEKKKREED